jgi:hypothetical protein
MPLRILLSKKGESSGSDFLWGRSFMHLAACVGVITTFTSVGFLWLKVHAISPPPFLWTAEPLIEQKAFRQQPFLKTSRSGLVQRPRVAAHRHARCEAGRGTESEEHGLHRKVGPLCDPLCAAHPQQDGEEQGYLEQP